MGQYIINTDKAYTQIICNTSVSIVGNYPNEAMRVSYSFQVRLTEYGSWYYNGYVFKFDGKTHTVNISISFGSGGGTTGVLASGYIDYSMGGTRYLAKSSSFSGSGIFSGSGTWSESATINEPNNYNLSGISNVTPFSVTLTSVFTNRFNFWQYVIYDTISGIQWNPTDNRNSCTTTISGLNPEQTYNFRMLCSSPDQAHKFTSGSTYDIKVTLPADQESAYIKVSGSWRNGKVWFKTGGSWRKVKAIYVKSNGIWKKSK